MLKQDSLSSDDKVCKYKKGNWSDCDPITRKKVRTLEIKKGPSSCKKKKTDTKQCNPKKSKSKGEKSKRKGKKRKGKKQKKKKGKGTLDGEFCLLSAFGP